MSYLSTKTYMINPQESFKVIRLCPKCARKTNFINTNNFRVNANKKAIDVWLIYQCEHCKHTYNLSIYERQPIHKLNPDTYRKFLENNKDLAYEYGINKNLFRTNKAFINQDEINYRVVEDSPRKNSHLIQVNKPCTITLHNPCKLRIRLDKVLSEILGLSRNQSKELLKKEGCKQKYIEELFVFTYKSC